MSAWTSLTAAEKSALVIRLVRKQGLSYTQAARELGTTKNAIAGALGRAEGRETHKVRKARPGRRPTKHLWSEENLSEPWAVWAARRKAERLAASKGKA